MREPPDIAEGAIVAALRASFGLRDARLDFLPIGNDSASWAYRVQAGRGPTYFLKVRAGAGPIPGAAVPGYLDRNGVPNVLAPLATGSGAPDVALDRFALALYPMLDARPGVEAGLSPEQWRQLGATLERVHTAPLTPELIRLVGRERFRPIRRELIEGIDALLAEAPRDPIAAELAKLWLARQDVIHALVERTDALGPRLAGMGFPQVLCHADLHTWNVLIDGGQRLWIVDWDEAVLAPRERDLMFVVGGIGRGLVRPRDTDAFFVGYGETTVDPVLLTYYRAAWAVQDLAAYGEAVLMMPGLGQESRRAALDGLASLFEPGNIVDIARGADGARPALG